MFISNRRRRYAAILAGVVSLSAPVASLAQPTAPQGDPQAFRRAQEELNKTPDTPGDGPYPAITR